MTRSRRDAGFTLIEMMTVVAILGVLATLAIVYMRPRTKPVDVATRFANLVQQANRTAIQYGVVRENVALAQASKRRTRITGDGTTFTLELLLEDAAPASTATWTTLETMTVAPPNTVDAYASSVGTYSGVTPATDWSSFVVSCYPNGACDAATLFISSLGGPTYERKARVSVLPLAGSPFIRTTWE